MDSEKLGITQPDPHFFTILLPEDVVKVVGDAGDEAEGGDGHEREPEVPPARSVCQGKVVEAVRRGPQAEP